jgi:hypothetical protein
MVTTKMADTIYAPHGSCLSGYHEGVYTNSPLHAALPEPRPSECPGMVVLSQTGQTVICNCSKNCHGTADLGRD